MLIQSPKHTTEDLRHWSEHEDGDFAHATLPTFKRKIEQAKQVIREFTSEPCYVGVSWGKDSVVLAHLAWSVFRDCNNSESLHPPPLAWIRVEPIKNPDCELVRDLFLRQFPCEYHEITRWCQRRGGDWRASGTLESGAAECAERFGGRRVLGIRSDESTERRLTCLRNGESSANSCRPLAWWSAADVMAYLAVEGLPVHPAYGMLGGGRYEREWLRVASLGGRRGDGMGRREWELEYYGDELRRLERDSRRENTQEMFPKCRLT